jgi:hypothetical protein
MITDLTPSEFPPPPLKFELRLTATCVDSELVLDTFGAASDLVAREVVKWKDETIRKWLISQGWIPPRPKLTYRCRRTWHRFGGLASFRHGRSRNRFVKELQLTNVK